jgi:hypothetical protein
VEKYFRGGQPTNDNVTLRMRFACLITKATNTHSEYVIAIAFPQQPLVGRTPSVLRYTYISPSYVLLWLCARPSSLVNISPFSISLRPKAEPKSSPATDVLAVASLGVSS